MLRLTLTLLLLTVLVAASDYGEAATIINIAPTGVATYSITATDLQESAGIDLLITYDAVALKTPQVKSGALTAGAMMEANVSIPGIVKIVFITAGAIKGTGELASVTFAGKGSTPKLSSSVYAASGAQLAVLSTSGSPQPPTDNKSDDGSVRNSAGSSTAVTGGGSAAGSVGSMSTSVNLQSTQTAVQTGSTVVSTLTLPASGDPKTPFLEDGRKDGIREETVYRNVPADSVAVESVRSAARTEVAAAAVASGDKTAGSRSTLKTSQSVLDRFRTYKDSRTVKRLMALFDESTLHAAGIVQSPAIVVSDGTSLVTVAVDLSHNADNPSFSLKGANLKSIRRVTDKKWELDALPQKGKSDVRLSIILKGERTEIPLVAVPPLNQTGANPAALSVAALDALLARPLKNSKPVYDLNSDGRQDYLDDYILLGHWLLKQQRSTNSVARNPAAAGK